MYVKTSPVMIKGKFYIKIGLIFKLGSVSDIAKNHWFDKQSWPTDWVQLKQIEVGLNSISLPLMNGYMVYYNAN